MEGWERSLCSAVRGASPSEAWVRLGAEVGSAGAPAAADPGALVWSGVVVLLALLGCLVTLGTLWSQSLDVNQGAVQMEDLVGISEAYLRSRALEKGVADALLTKAGLTPAAVEPEPAPEEEAEEPEEDPKPKKKKKRKKKKQDGEEGEEDYDNLSIGSRLPEHAK